MNNKGSGCLAIYFGGFGIAALVENFLYLRYEGFWSWLFFGEIVATFKALFWPVTLFQWCLG